MSRSVSISCYPSVRLIAIIVLIAFCTAANFWPAVKTTASDDIENARDYGSESDRFHHSTDNIQISNSQCPSFCECEHHGTAEISVYCHEGGLEHIGFSKLLKQIPREVTVLDVEAPLDNPNHLLWDDNLNQFRHLRVLRLVNCAIPAISHSLKLHTLEVLDLRGNRIQHLPVSVFSGVSSIRELNLARNSLSALPTGTFTYLKNLQTLSLAYNNITSVTVNLLRGLRNLKSLHLDGNRIPVSQFNLLFANIPQLERLELNECGLSIGAVSDLALEKFHSLKQLGFAGNRLGKVPISVLRNHLSSLTTLDLSDNELVEIEAGIFAKSNITRLLLAGNHLGTNPNSLSFNSLKTGLALRELDLSRNSFEHFKSEYLGIARETVEILHLNRNYITNVGQWLIANMTKLKMLHLGYNFIEHLPRKLPNEFAQLIFLNLSGNQLSLLPKHFRDILRMLRMIDISKNRFTSFPITVVQNFFNSLEKVSFSSVN
ncbi:unnamed protein product [Litomosoides sigmodontis]|uniref:LRRNT domain-containing protein n=1 Tax=Litomosoides sigmodontis TaxID=42156 RepID=A0A3P6TDA7_LITSI|nr:unnamed protein product [Litomosoides sigmodontis]